jgi:undecaprenyl-diphosphatase
VGSRGGKFGFISSHATNAFALATFLSLLFRKPGFTIFMFTWAAVVSYSRIYLGLHYPADILGGALLGVLISLLIFILYKRLTNKYKPDKQN